MLWCFRDREQILDMFEEICGSRFNHNYYRPGGLLYDFPPGLLSKLERFLERWEKNIEEYRELIEGNEIFLERTVGIGVFDAKTAIAYGIGGPMLRATGVPHEIRVDRPYGIYPELKEMRPVTAQDGDAFSRYLVRLGELKLVIALVRECMDKLPGGPVRARVGHVFKAKPNEVYVPIEGAKGEIGYYMIGVLEGLRATMRHILNPSSSVTRKYPYERRELPERSRGLIALLLEPETNIFRCESCLMCEKACPPRAISISYRYRDGFRRRPPLAPRAAYYRMRMVQAAPYGDRRPLGGAVVTVPEEAELPTFDPEPVRRI